MSDTGSVVAHQVLWRPYFYGDDAVVRASPRREQRPFSSAGFCRNRTTSRNDTDQQRL